LTPRLSTLRRFLTCSSLSQAKACQLRISTLPWRSLSSMAEGTMLNAS
jgi:hypothetical protein